MPVLLEQTSSLVLEGTGSLLLEDGLGGGSVPTPLRIGTPPLKTSLSDVTLAAPTLESLEVDVYCSDDPTDTEPQFAVTTEGTAVTDATTYTPGGWATTYGTDGWTTARTPSFGSAGTIVTVSNTRLWLWVKTVAGDETAVWRVGTVIVL